MQPGQKVVEGARLSAHGELKGKLVKFVQDVFPHVVGDIKRVADKELERVDAKAKAMNLKGKVYEVLSTKDIEEVNKAKDEAIAKLTKVVKDSN